jgi:nicotinate-nucleotide adenylyltransferase
MRKLCFGGSFNPIHHGHLICARVVAESTGFDRVVLIPSNQAPHKSGVTDMAASADRLEMCRAVVQNDPFFEVSDLELTRPGPSFTIESARQLRRAGWAEVFWLIGADMAISLPTWQEPDALLAEVKFLLMARPGWTIDWTTLPPGYQFLKSNVIPAPSIDISSSEIRKRVAAGKSIQYLTPDPVLQYIQTHGLYLSNSGRE